MRTRRGFTLVEMLVVITILLVLTAMTVTAVNFTLDGERVRAGSRQVQSYLEGARSRAIYAKEPRGVRFLLDQTANQSGRLATVSSMIYIGPPPEVSTGNGDGFVALERKDQDAVSGPDSMNLPVEYVHLLNNNGATDWFTLFSKGLIVDGVTRIQILRDSKDETGRWFTVRTTYPDGTACLTQNRQILRLSQPFPNVEPSLLTPDSQVVGYSAGKYNWFRLELPMTALPSEEPVLLPQGIVIDLDHSSLPLNWQAAGIYSGKMDIVFTPRGTVTGPPAAKGIIHFLVTDRADTDVGAPASAPPGTLDGVPPDAVTWDSSTSYIPGQWVKPPVPNGFYYQTQNMGGGGTPPNPWPTQPGVTVNVGGVDYIGYPRNDKLIVSLFTQTGNISSHHVYEAPPGASMDWFRYAETGEVAGN